MIHKDESVTRKLSNLARKRRIGATMSRGFHADEKTKNWFRRPAYHVSGKENNNGIR